jgi:large subunit ribosomal protein MRP49
VNVLLTLNRKFWRYMLPRLKFHNPNVPMTVTRTTDKNQPALLSVYFKKVGMPAESQPGNTVKKRPFRPLESIDKIVVFSTWKEGPEPTAEEEIVQIDMKNKKEEEILDELLELTKADAVMPTPGELDTMSQLKEQAQRSDMDAARQRELRMAMKREKEALRLAQGSMAEQDA